MCIRDSFEMETALASEWSTETSMETEWTYGMDFDAGRDSHRVVLIQTPAIVYDYVVKEDVYKRQHQERVRIFGFFWRDVERQTTTNGAYLHIDAEFFIINSVY